MQLIKTYFKIKNRKYGVALGKSPSGEFETTYCLLPTIVLIINYVAYQIELQWFGFAIALKIWRW